MVLYYKFIIFLKDILLYPKNYIQVFIYFLGKNFFKFFLELDLVASYLKVLEPTILKILQNREKLYSGPILRVALDIASQLLRYQNKIPMKQFTELVVKNAHELLIIDSPKVQTSN